MGGGGGGGLRWGRTGMVEGGGRGVTECELDDVEYVGAEEE